MTTVVRVTRPQNYTLYIGRAWAGLSDSKWANPYRINRSKPLHQELSRVLSLYEAYVRSRPDLMKSLYEIDGQVLGCWCAPNLCHGDILVKLRKEQLSGLGNQIRAITFGADSQVYR